MPRASSRSSARPASSSSRADREHRQRVLALGHRPLGGPHADRRHEQALLGAVVQVALDPPPRVVAGGDEPGARRLQLGDPDRLQLALPCGAPRPRGAR